MPSRDDEEFFIENPSGFEGEGLRPISYVLAEALALVDAWQNGDVSGGFPTGLGGLDRYIRLVPTELVVIGARPGMGKTALAMQIAANAVPDPDSNDRVAIFSAEMAGRVLLLRMACATAEVSMAKLRRSDVSPEDYAAVKQALRTLTTMPIWIADRSAPDYTYMRQQILLMQQDYNLVGVVFDFMELLRTTGRATEERASMAAIALKDIAKEFNVPVIAISQLNREVEERADKFPRLSDLRSSGMIEQLADIVLLMTRPKYYRDKGIAVDMRGIDKMVGPTNIDDPCYIVVAKNRNGESGISLLGYDGKRMMFEDIARTPLIAADVEISEEDD